MKWLGIFQVGIFWVGIFPGGTFLEPCRTRNFTEHSELLQTFTVLYSERTLFSIDKANRNLKSY